LQNPYIFEQFLERMGMRPQPILHAEISASAGQFDKSIAAPPIAQFYIHMGPLRARISAHPPGTLSQDCMQRLVNADHFGSRKTAENFLDSAFFIALVPDAMEDAESARVIDVLRLLYQMAYQCCVALHPEYIFWSPANLWSSAECFAESVEEMFKSGLPPVLHMVAFVPPHSDLADLDQKLEGADDGILNADPAAVARISRGLALFCGQEVWAIAPKGMDEAQLLRRVARLAADMMVNGPIVEQHIVPGIDPGERIHLLPTFQDRDHVGLVRVIIIPAGTADDQSTQLA
jgi:hypothetical protein